MNETPSDLKFLDSHEWVKVDDNTVIVGISDHAQNELGEVVFVELPAIGDEFVSGDEAAVVESVKAASEVYTPLSGEVIEVNEALEENPELVNTSPYEDGWFFKLRVSDENLGSTDMTIKNNPFESNLGWVVDFSDVERDFIAKENLIEIQKINKLKLVGVLLNEKGILRSGQKIIKDDFEGEVTSGTFSPYIKKSIGLARVPMAINGDANVQIRNKLLNVKLLSLPFIRKGKIMI